MATTKNSKNSCLIKTPTGDVYHNLQFEEKYLIERKMYVNIGRSTQWNFPKLNQTSQKE